MVCASHTITYCGRQNITRHSVRFCHIVENRPVDSLCSETSVSLDCEKSLREKKKTNSRQAGPNTRMPAQLGGSKHLNFKVSFCPQATLLCPFAYVSLF